MRDEKKEERSKQGQANNKEKQHKAVTFPKDELPQVGLDMHIHISPVQKQHNNYTAIYT